MASGTATDLDPAVGVTPDQVIAGEFVGGRWRISRVEGFHATPVPQAKSITVLQL
jgi:hypothetical protein